MNGDLVPAPDWAEIVCVGLRDEFIRGKRGRPKHKRSLEVAGITKLGSTALLDRIKEIGVTALGVPTTVLKPWTPLRWVNSKFDELSAQGALGKAGFTTEEKSAAEQLRDRNLWKLATAVKVAGRMLVADLSQVGAPRRPPSWRTHIF